MDRSVSPRYRPDIDGLRAVAILFVVFYHAFPMQVQGGFTGVDIFFVISGFLISIIIFENLSLNRFTFTTFFIHRIKRIFPALIVVLLACIVIGWLILLPEEYEYLGKHIIGGAIFINNFILFNESGYFDQTSDLKPLLHLWTLGVEEQFYIIWPLMLWFSWKKRINWIAIILPVLLVSFILNLYGVMHNPVGTFYFPQTRFWELLIGSFIAYVTLYRQNWILMVRKKLAYYMGTYGTSFNEGKLKNVESTIGFIMILLALIFTKNKDYPGIRALLPVIGSGLIIAAGPQAFFNRAILSNKLFIFLGIISYPLYLWHWPLLSFARIIDGKTPQAVTRLELIVVALILAWITYRFVEKPFRFSAAQSSYKIASLLIGMCIICGAGFAIKKDFIYPRFHEANILQYWKLGGEYPKPEGLYTDAEYGLPAVGHSKFKIILYGDSHAEQYLNTFAQISGNPPSDAFRKNNMNKNGSFEVVLLEATATQSFDQLLDKMKEREEKILNDPTVSTVIFSFFWALEYGSDKINYAIRCCGNAADGSIGGSKYHQPPSRKLMDRFDAKFQNMAELFVKSGKKVYFVLDNPFGEEVTPHNLIARSIFHGIHIRIKPLKKETVLQRDEPIRSRIIKVAQNSGAKVIDPVKYLCGPVYCPAISSNKTPIYKDYDHLSYFTVITKVHYFDFLASGTRLKASTNP